MVYYLRAHHAKDLDKLLKTHPLRMFISNLIWYGFKEAVFRYRLIKQIKGDKYAKVKVVNGRDDIICKGCRHFNYCNTNFDAYRNKRMQLYEKYLLNGKLHKPYDTDDLIYRELFPQSSLPTRPASTVPPSSLE